MAKQAQVPLAAVIKPFATIPSNEVRMEVAKTQWFANSKILLSSLFLYTAQYYKQEADIYYTKPSIHSIY
jgi:hypothetical protein